MLTNQETCFKCKFLLTLDIFLGSLTWNVSDACGNPAVQRTQIITVDDTTPPVLAMAPANVTVECIEDVPAMTDLSWTDNCDAGGMVTGADGMLE